MERDRDLRGHDDEDDGHQNQKDEPFCCPRINMGCDEDTDQQAEATLNAKLGNEVDQMAHAALPPMNKRSTAGP